VKREWVGKERRGKAQRTLSSKSGIPALLFILKGTYQDYIKKLLISFSQPLRICIMFLAGR